MTQLLSMLSPYKGQGLTIVDKQTTPHIMSELQTVHQMYAPEYDKIARLFWKGNIRDTAKHLFDFLKNNVEYKIESEFKQTSKPPAGILAEGRGDCKHYASFVCGVVDSLKRQGYPIECEFVYANGYDTGEGYHHVFAAVRDTAKGKEYWVDPIDDKTFDYRENYKKLKKVTPMALIRMSGDKYGRYDMVEIGGLFKNRQPRAVRRENRQANREQRKANKEAKKAEKAKIKAMPRPQRKAYKQAKRAEEKSIKKSANGVQKTSHVLMKVPNAISRNAFCGLLKINAFRMAAKIAKKYSEDAAWRDELKKQWFAAGGQWGALKQAVNQGVNVYNTKFSPKIAQISGEGESSFVPIDYTKYGMPNWQRSLCNCDSYDQLYDAEVQHNNKIGEPDTAIAVAAMVAAAMPLILKLIGLLRRAGVNEDELKEAEEDSTNDVIDEYNDAVDYPVDEDEPGSGTGNSDVPYFDVDAYNDPTTGEATIKYKKTNLNSNGDVDYADTFDLQGILDKGRNFYEENKGMVWGTVGVLAAIKFGPDIIKALKPSGKKRR